MNDSNKQDRSIHIGNAGQVQNITGDNVTINSSFSGSVTINSAEDFIKAMQGLKELMGSAKINLAQHKEMEAAISEAESEAGKDNPDKGKIANALEKAISIAKLADNVKELTLLATPYITQAANWLGESGSHLTGLLGVG